VSTFDNSPSTLSQFAFAVVELAVLEVEEGELEVPAVVPREVVLDEP